MSVFVFAPFVISRSLSERKIVEHAHLRNNVRVLGLMTIIYRQCKQTAISQNLLIEKFDIQPLKQS